MGRTGEQRNRIAGLDLLRGLAIALVLLRHAVPDLAGGAGIVGVVVFFALSGYLITSILHRDLLTRGRVRYGHFYRNRALRLIPALLLMLIGLIIVTVVADPLDDRDRLLRTVLVAVTYTGDVPFNGSSNATGHLWTLATEEQFYIFWPLIIALGLRIRRLRTIVGLTAAALMIVLVASAAFVAPSFGLLYRLPTSWALAILIGAIGYFARDIVARALPSPGSRGALAVGLLAFVVLLGFSAVPDPKDTVWAYLVIGPATAALAVVIINYVRHWRDLPHPAFRPVLALGTISYAVYLWNYPITVWLQPLGNALVTGVGSVVLSIFAGIVSWYTIERPVAGLKRKLDLRHAQAAAPSAVTANDQRVAATE